MTNLSNIPKTEKVKLIRKTFEKLVKKVKDDKNKEQQSHDQSLQSVSNIHGRLSMIFPLSIY